MRRSVFLFCFVLFFSYITLEKNYEITLFRYKAQNEAKRKEKKRRKQKKKKKKKKIGEGVKINWNFQLMYRKKNARAPATDLIRLSNRGPKYVLILGYRCLSHLLKIHFLKLFDVMSSLIHIHMITFDDLYHADCIVLFLVASKII